MRKATCHEGGHVRATPRVKGRAEAQVAPRGKASGRGKAGGRMAWVTLSMLFLAALTGCEQSKSPSTQNHASGQNRANTKTQDNPPAVTPAVQQPRPEATLPRPAQPAAAEAPVAQTSAQGSTASPEDASELAVAPRDECSGRADWSAFRAQITASLHTRDAARFAALAAPDVELDYGGGSGRADLARRLNDQRLGLWNELDQILHLGCGVAGDLVVLPWVFWNVPDDIDPYRAMIVLGEAVPLLAQPNPSARVRTSLDWALVTVGDGFKPSARYSAVTTRGGQKGFIETIRLRSLLDYRLIAEHRDGQWQITAFIAGD